MTEDVVEDGFLDGRVRLRQPRKGYRAATDPVLLAASVSARAGQSVLDLGCGAGTAALCLAARVPGLDLQGLEIQESYASLARENATLNGVALAVHTGDLRAMPAALKTQTFDGVMLNPPWHEPANRGSPDLARDRANRLDIPLGDWIGAALSRLRPGGWIHVIQRAEALPEILTALDVPAGQIAVLPLASRIGRPAKRVIVKARKGAKGPFRLMPALVMHEGPAHLADEDDFTDQARAILRDGAPLEF